ncbi:hypothetical protein [Galactobacter caseinivorans]|uniref:Uncharacterized protein n=1 Tax=Galactobacter caseinivorans TaxID=2676123 RepID=A0A496PMT1_9MICC|nr:hypothetical protein [Galactobacter caseinivorans]RKW71838.1 hypothetical protein DWQ67_03135 [Galactobacter caseinivorans]
MEAPQKQARQIHIHAVATLAGVLGLAAVGLALVMSVGVLSSIGPTLFLMGAVCAVFGFALRFDARQKLNDHLGNDPRFRPSN